MKNQKEETIFGIELAWAPYLFVVVGAAAQILALIGATKGWY